VNDEPVSTTGPTLNDARASLPGEIEIAIGDDRITPESPDRYTLKVEVGRGGIGRVFAAFDEHVGREIAIKELLCEARDEWSDGDPVPPAEKNALKARFLREARVTGQLEHPAIVPVYEIGRRADGSCYYTMRYIKGRTLLSALRKQPDLAERLKLLPHFHDLCNAIAYAHSKGVIHRDLKPDNVMIGEFGETVVLDWGLAKAKGQQEPGDTAPMQGLYASTDAGIDRTVEGRLLGTPAYMPPEQARGAVGEIDEKSDIYALGAVLYELLTGRPPHTGRTIMDVLAKVQGEPVVPADKRDKRVPRELSAIAEKALNRKKERRYDSARQLAADIESYMAGDRVGAYRYTWWELFRLLFRKHKPLLVSLLAIIAVTAIAFVRVVSERDAARHSLGLVLLEKAQSAAEKKRGNDARIYALSAYELLRGDDRAAKVRTRFFNAGDAYRSRTVVQAAERGGLYEGHAAFSPDRRIAASGSAGNIVKVWDLATGRELASLAGHQEHVNGIAFSPDGKTLASGSSDKTVRIWDISSGKERRALADPAGGINCVAFSPDGKTLASGNTDHAVKLWNLGTGEEIATLAGHAWDVFSLAFSPDGKTLASGSYDNTVKLWDTLSGKERATLTGHAGCVWSVAFSPDGGTLATGSRDNTIRLWDPDAATERAVLTGHEGCVNRVDFSADGKTLASASDDRSVKLWDIALRAETATLTGHADWVLSVGFSPDGKTLLSGDRFNTIKRWDIAPGNEITTLRGHNEWVLGVAFSPDGGTLASGSRDNSIKLWEVPSGKEVASLNGHEKSVWSVAFSPDGKTLASGSRDNTIRLWDLAAGKERSTLPGHADWVLSVVFSPDGKTLASGGRDSVVKLWDPTTGKEQRSLVGHEGGVYGVAFSPDGKLLATASDDRTIRLWDAAAGDPIATLQGHDGGVYGLAFSPDGKMLASGSDDKTAKLWSIAERKAVATLTGHTDCVNSVSFSPDGKTLASGSYDTTIKLWELPAGTERATLTGHAITIFSVAFSPQGGILASGSWDRTVKMWDLAAMERELTDLLADPRRAEETYGLRLDRETLTVIPSGEKSEE